MIDVVKEALMNSPSSAEPPQPVFGYDFQESIGYWIVLTSQALQKALNDELSPHGVTYRQSQVLGWLALKANSRKLNWQPE